MHDNITKNRSIIDLHIHSTYSDGANTIEEKWRPLVGNGKEKMPDVGWYSRSHTNSLVPFYAKGAGSERFVEKAKSVDPVRGKYIDNAEVGKVLLSF